MEERRKRGRPHIHPEKRPDAIAAYVAGATPQSIANAIGVSSATVVNWVREAGVKRSHRVPEELVEQAIADYVAGMSATEVAKKHGVSRQSVIRWLKRAGVATGPSS